eukprot:CAMPEP_0170472502 /NCGR_PEP_ID=MMETSP0123-20130129/14533_1 /TAXON_ID=182087 /ORGANISM="Favella ehrenbergii, Strain Fehren 1" /LENGTH=68 /DNA_ID=CAMNT_0010740837 /DNA_START=423 /DNA_END=629 /DNA_ORIENTATION=-
MQDRLPLTSFSVDAQYPCVNPYFQPKATGQIYYPAEYVKEGCPTDPSTGENHDLRYRGSGFNTNIYDM